MNIVQCLKFAFAASFYAFFWLLTNLTSTLFLIFVYSFSEDRFVHQLEEIFFKFMRCFRMQLRVELKVISLPRFFNKTDSFMNHFDTQTKALIQLECFVRNNASPYHSNLEQVSLLCLSSTSQQEVDIPWGDLVARSDIQDQFEGYKEYLASCQSQLEVNRSNI